MNIASHTPTGSADDSQDNDEEMEDDQVEEEIENGEQEETEEPGDVDKSAVNGNEEVFHLFPIVQVRIFIQ